ncbi:hypothetical protein [Lusitaniella coriacea]|uniref:hypothetical protein n=1 Tax=Lusitaniella coriacea TaxID=1983105 RepID=UPI003CF5A64D
MKLINETDSLNLSSEADIREHSTVEIMPESLDAQPKLASRMRTIFIWFAMLTGVAAIALLLVMLFQMILVLMTGVVCENFEQEFLAQEILDPEV